MTTHDPYLTALRSLTPLTTLLALDFGFFSFGAVPMEQMLMQHICRGEGWAPRQETRRRSSGRRYPVLVPCRRLLSHSPSTTLSTARGTTTRPASDGLLRCSKPGRTAPNTVSATREFRSTPNCMRGATTSPAVALSAASAPLSVIATRVTVRWSAALAIVLSNQRQQPSVATVSGSARPCNWSAALSACLAAWPTRTAWGRHQALHVDNALLHCGMWDHAMRFGSNLHSVTQAAIHVDWRLACLVHFSTAPRRIPAPASILTMEAIPTAQWQAAAALHHRQLIAGETFPPAFYHRLVSKYGCNGDWGIALRFLRPVVNELPCARKALLFAMQAADTQRVSWETALRVLLDRDANGPACVSAAVTLIRADQWHRALSVFASTETKDAQRRHVIGLALQREGVRNHKVAALVEPEFIRPSTARQRRKKALRDKKNKTSAE